MDRRVAARHDIAVRAQRKRNLRSNHDIVHAFKFLTQQLFTAAWPVNIGSVIEVDAMVIGIPKHRQCVYVRDIAPFFTSEFPGPKSDLGDLNTCLTDLAVLHASIQHHYA